MTQNHKLVLMLIYAHPDDEVMTGGVTARAAARGIRVVLVVATRGDEGEIQDPELARSASQSQLAGIREAELHDSAAILGIDRVDILGYRDSGMAASHENSNPDNFKNADRREVVGRLVRLMREERPQVVVTFDEHGGYGHPDHIAAHLATLAAVREAADAGNFPKTGPPWQVDKLYQRVFSRSAGSALRETFRRRGIPSPVDRPGVDLESLGTPDDLVTTRVDVGEFAQRKIQALHAHRSQVGPDDLFANMPPDLSNEIWGTETFLRSFSRVPVPDREDDLFAGIGGQA
jgi:N-acetyl-1-D-myo-inositol-2-amino-2-deoxy-alpha-D-glucopyranoside deacetylase